MTNAAATAPFSATPSIERSANVAVSAATSVPESAAVVGVAVGTGGDVPASLGLDRARLAAAGFNGDAGSALVVPSAQGATLVAVGVGDLSSLDAAGLRTAAAAFARAIPTHGELAFSLDGTDSVDAEPAAQAVVEGVLLARYQFHPLRSDPPGTVVTALTVVTDEARQAAATAGAARGRVLAAVAQLSRDLANTPHNFMTASTFADIAETVGADRGLSVEVFDKDALLEMGCGGLLGVNAGSAEPPRMVKLTYRPESGDPAGRLTLVGKGIMYDSGGIALKPGDESHATMKNDMSGAGAILAAMSALSELGCRNEVVGYLMCTDNMPSGTAMALGDVITMRDGTTVEVINTDAEGRLVMADGLALGTEEPTDAIVDIATLTGACMRALGTQIAGVMGNHQGLVDQISAAADATDEAVWQLPLAHRYDKDIMSPVADLRNMGTTPNGGAIHAALFLAKFVGDVPWAHIDIAGTAQSTGDAGWLTVGCTGFGARLLAQLAVDFSAPGS